MGQKTLKYVWPAVVQKFAFRSFCPWSFVGKYVFASNNPFVGDDQALAKGKDLFRWAMGRRRERAAFGALESKRFNCVLAYGPHLLTQWA